VVEKGQLVTNSAYSLIVRHVADVNRNNPDPYPDAFEKMEVQLGQRLRPRRRTQTCTLDAVIFMSI